MPLGREMMLELNNGFVEGVRHLSRVVALRWYDPTKEVEGYSGGGWMVGAYPVTRTDPTTMVR